MACIHILIRMYFLTCKPVESPFVDFDASFSATAKGKYSASLAPKQTQTGTGMERA